MKELYGDTYNLSPRWNQWIAVETADGTSASGYYYFIDIEREKEIAIGTSWPYPDLKTGECLLSSDWKDSIGVAEGDEIELEMNNSVWPLAGKIYNKYFLKDGDVAVNTNSMSSNGDTKVPCKVKGIISAGEGKFPSIDLSSLVILPEFQTFLPYLYNHTTFNSQVSSNQGFKDYILNTPNISDQYANILVGTLPA